MDTEENKISFPRININLNLKRKRKRKKTKEESKEEEISSNKKKKMEYKDYLIYTQRPKNSLYETFSKKIDSYLISRKIYTTSSESKYKYVCQEIKSDSNSIQIKDAKMIILENKTLLFLLSNDILYIYQIKEHNNFEKSKEISLNQQDFSFSYSPKNIFFITPPDKKPRKNQTQNNQNNNKVRTRMIVNICIVSCKERYLCQFDLKNLTFKKIKNIIAKKNMAQNLINNDMKYKLYSNNKILSYNKNCAYIQRLYNSPKFKNLKQKNIESISLLNDNLFSISTPDVVYVYETKNETNIGEFKTLTTIKKAKLIKPENNLLLAYSSSEIALYDLESLMFFQKLDINYILNNESIRKVKQLNNNNIAILFTLSFAVYNMEKNTISYKCNYWNNNIYDNDFNGVLMEISPNVTLVNNDENNIYLFNCIKGDQIAYLNMNDNSFSLCKKIKRYNFKYGLSQDKSIEEDKIDKKNNYVWISNKQNTFILDSMIEE